MILFSVNNYSQNTDILGVILDEENLPFIGANIVLNDKEYGTVSDVYGQFFIKDIPIKQYVMSVTYIGYESIIIEFNADTLKSSLSIFLNPLVQELEEVQVNGSIHEKKRKTESISIQLIEEEFLKEAKAANLMKTLENVPGINSMDVGTGISKPMIRGMGYYRVVVAQNGIKQEGQQWSNHHGISIDQQAVSHVEIIKGPASLQYGSDAIGGVINILPSHVPLSGGLIGEVSITGKTNTNWMGGSASLSYRNGDVYTNIVMTHNSYGDFRIPETDSFLLPAPVSAAEASHKIELGNQIYNTAGRESAVSLKTGFVKSWGNSYLEFNYYTTNTGFFDWQGIQNDSLRMIHSENDRDINLPYQKVHNYSINHFTNRYFNQNKLEVAIGYQANISNEHSYLSDRTGNRSEDLNHFKNLDNLELRLNLQTWSGNIFYTLNSQKKQTIKIGFNTQYQHNTTDGYNHILPNYIRFSSGIFITHRYTFSQKWILSSGARFDCHLFEMGETVNPDPDFGDSVFNPAFNETYPAVSFAAGVNYLPSSNTIFKANLGKSYRIPSAYELSAYGLHRHEGRFEKGDVNNNPEQAWQLDLGFEQKWNHLQLRVSPFLNYFTNYLYLNPTSALRPEGQVYEYQQIRAMLAGGEVSIDYVFLKNLNLRIGTEYVYAVNLDLSSALPFTPPFNIKTEINYLFKNTKALSKSKIGIEAISVSEQKYTVQNELTTPGYITFNFNGKTEISIGKQKVSLMLKIRNLLDSKYYNHISFYRRLRIPEPGRDIQIFINVPF